MYLRKVMPASVHVFITRRGNSWETKHNSVRPVSQEYPQASSVPKHTSVILCCLRHTTETIGVSR